MSGNKERPLIEGVAHAKGRYGGFSFGGSAPEGVVVRDQLPKGVAFPNGAKAALLMTYDVEGTYGNGIGDMAREISNYGRICERLRKNRIPATFNVVGKMAEEQGADFVRLMLDSGCEVAPHGYVHDLNKRLGGDLVYAGHYGYEENLQQARDGIAAINAIRPGTVRGIRLPYGHFNEFTYRALADCGLLWASHCGIDDYVVPGQGCGGAPFTMQLGDEVFPIVEIPLDSQTYDWSMWMADEAANAAFVKAARAYCGSRGIAFKRTPAGAVEVWRRRMQDAIEGERVFTLLCHPINLAVQDPRWGDPVDEFMLPVLDILGEYQRSGQAWVCTCSQLAEFYKDCLDTAKR